MRRVHPRDNIPLMRSASKLGLCAGKSLHDFCDLSRQTHREANHGRKRAPYSVGPSSSRAAHAVPPHPLRRCVAPPQCLCRLGSVRRRGPSRLGGGILREHCRQRGARRHDATRRGAPPWGAQPPARDCVSGTFGRPIACNLHGTDGSLLPTGAAPRPAGLGETLLSSPRAPPGPAVYHHAAHRTGDARLGYPVCARPHRRTVPPTASRFLWNWFHVSCRSSACSQTPSDWRPCAVTLR